ncbi:MAG: thioredoxin family protein [Candidatus Diapherotrites archaeon]|nr:thioredoxin family protein [Candidatus Diapherotrites archaeon]
MNRHVQAALVTLGILVMVFAVVSWMDSSRISTLNSGIESLSVQSETNRILFFYNQVFTPSEDTAFCDVLDKSATLRSDEGDLFFSKLVAYENANLLGNYNTLRQKYLLNRIELWLYTTLLTKQCKTNIVPILFFYRNKPACPQCDVQGQILESLREKCPNVKIFALSVDEGIDLVPLIEAQYGVHSVPSVVVNKKVFESLSSEEILRQEVACSDQLLVQKN